MAGNGGRYGPDSTSLSLGGPGAGSVPSSVAEGKQPMGNHQSGSCVRESAQEDSSSGVMPVSALSREHPPLRLPAARPRKLEARSTNRRPALALQPTVASRLPPEATAEAREVGAQAPARMDHIPPNALGFFNIHSALRKMTASTAMSQPEMGVTVVVLPKTVRTTRNLPAST